MNISETESINAANDPKSAGRWTNEEHILFLQGLQLYNKQWKLIADLVKTRTVVQIRTHAQKYFLKMQKSKQINDKSYAQLASIMRSDSIDSTVYNQDYGASTGATTSEGESDNERSLSINSEDRLPSIMLPKLLLTKSDGDLKSKTDSPRKRSREVKGTPKMKNSTAKSPKRSNARSISSSALNSLCAMSREVELLQEENLGLSVEKFCEYIPYEDDGSTEFDDNFFDRIEWNHRNYDEDSDSRSQSPFSRSASHVNGAPPSFPNLTFEEIGNAHEPSFASSYKESRGLFANPSEDSYELPSFTRPNLTLTIGNHSALQNSSYQKSFERDYPNSDESSFSHPINSGFNFNVFPPPASPARSPRKRGRPKKYSHADGNSASMDVEYTERARSESMMSIGDAPEPAPLLIQLPNPTIGMSVVPSTKERQLPSIADQFTSNNTNTLLSESRLPTAPSLLTSELTRLSLPSSDAVMEAAASKLTVADLLPLATSPSSEGMFQGFHDSVRLSAITESHY
mmetsp:Transcript_27408/g.29912  ORF Transcript_27408/g.29912 Transcript_27408/m.29912 type:complete len:515 (+) Transcript_27408:184-1728(+)